MKRFYLSITDGELYTEGRMIANGDDYSEMQKAMSDFLENPENMKKYRITPYQTVHSWKNSTDGTFRKRLIDFGDYSNFFEITEFFNPK